MRAIGLGRIMLAAALLGAAPPVLAGAIQYALVSKTAGEVMVEIRLTCPHRVEGQEPATAAQDVVVRLTRLPTCAGAGVSGGAHESSRPAGREMAGLDEVTYDATGLDAAAVRLRFREPALVLVRQEGDPLSLRLVVTPQPGAAGATGPSGPPRAGAVPPPPPELNAEQKARLEERLRALTTQGQTAVAAAGGDYAINLASSTGPPDAAGVPAAAAAGRQVYVVTAELDGQAWQQLRLGFYASEQEAESALKGLVARYPNAWATRVGAAEKSRAIVGTVAAGPAAVTAVRPPDTGQATLKPDEIEGLMAEARAAVVNRKYDRAILIYTRVLAEPRNASSAEAEEFLGVARDRNGQVPEAVAQYRQYLADYPQGEGASRVGQRLIALTTARDAPKSGLRAAGRGGQAGAWDTFGSFSQYYRRDSGNYSTEGTRTYASAVLTDGDLSVRRPGERVDFAGRATLGYDWDLMNGPAAPGSRTRIYNLYADLSDRDWGLEARVGRQTDRSAGVLGRYDGAHLSWLLRPDIKLNVRGGFPVYLSSDGLDTSRVFYGASVDFNRILQHLDTSVFFNMQTVDGMTDREAVGAEFRWFDGTRSVFGVVDYDFNFGTLNTATFVGNWSFASGLTVSASADYRHSPFPLTENALIGQSASSIDELKQTLTEDQIHQLAKDRSGEMLTYTIGASKPLAERWQVNADFAVTQIAEGPTSGGVPALPDSGTTYYAYLNFVGSSLFTEGDVNTIGFRYADTVQTKVPSLYLDSRFPLTNQLRLNPRLTASWRKIQSDSSSETLLRPALRLLYRFARHWEIELEGGGEFGNRNGADNVNTTGYYLYAGYRADF